MIRPRFTVLQAIAFLAGLALAGRMIAGRPGRRAVGGWKTANDPELVVRAAPRRFVPENATIH